jgi:rhomboid protease GluP
VVSNLTHTGQYLSVGASGAISGILGALLCLRLLAKVDLALNFFVVNIGLNIALAFSARNIDWGAHVGGFAGGMIACAMLELVERASCYLLRCKFPEFAKLNLFLLAVGSPVLVQLFVGGPPWSALLACLGGGLVVVKLLDIVLSRTKGLAIAVVGFSIANAVLFLFLALALVPVACSRTLTPVITHMRSLLITACAHLDATLAVVAIVVLMLTLLLYSQELHRGIKDIGFVAASLTGERKRRHGI